MERLAGYFYQRRDVGRPTRPVRDGSPSDRVVAACWHNGPIRRCRVNFSACGVPSVPLAGPRGSASGRESLAEYRTLAWLPPLTDFVTIPSPEVRSLGGIVARLTGSVLVLSKLEAR